MYPPSAFRSMPGAMAWRFLSGPSGERKMRCRPPPPVATDTVSGSASFASSRIFNWSERHQERLEALLTIAVQQGHE